MKTVPLLMITVALTALVHGAEQRVIHSQPSWVIATPQIELAITERGGHMAPVTFFRDTAKPVQPYHISPWQDEGLTGLGAPLCHAPGEIAWTTATRTDDRKPRTPWCAVEWAQQLPRAGGRHGVFADGLVASAQPNILTKEGVATAIELRADRPTAVNYIQGVAKVPAGFDVVKTAEFKPGEVTFISARGQRVTVPVRHEFLKNGKL